MNLKSLFKETALYGMSSVLGRFLNYLLVVVHTRFFLNEQAVFGQISEFYAYTGLLMIFFTYGMETGFFRFYNNATSEEEKRKVYSTGCISIFVTTFIFCLFFILFSKNIANVLEYPHLQNIILFLILILGLDTLSTLPFALLRQQNKPLKFVGIRLLNIFINIILTLVFLVLFPYLEKIGVEWISIFYKKEWGIYYVFGANLLASLITFLGLSFELKYIEWKFDWELWKKMLKYSAPLLIVGTAGIINDTFDRVMLKYFLPGTLDERNALVGLYSAGAKIAVVITMFIQAFKMGAEPYFFKIAKQEDAKNQYATIMNYFVWAVCCVFLANCLYIDILKWIIAPTYFAGLVVVPIASLGRIFLGIYYNQSVWYKNTGQTMIGAVIAAFGAFCTIVLDMYLIPKIGYVGAAWGSTIAFFIMMLLSYFLGQKYYPVNYHFKKIFLIFAFTGSVYFLFLFSKNALTSIGWDSSIISFITASLMMMIYLVAVFYFVFEGKIAIPFLRKKA